MNEGIKEGMKEGMKEGRNERRNEGRNEWNIFARDLLGTQMEYSNGNLQKASMYTNT